MKSARGRRGRPPKFGRRGQVVALTLPEDVVAGLKRLDRDLAWAVVRLYERAAGRRAPQGDRAVADLVRVAERRSLIVVDRAGFTRLPGVTIVPVSATRAFLALEPGLGISDLELKVNDRLEEPSIDAREQRALARLRAQLRRWRRDRSLRFHTRAIIEVEELGAPRRISREKS
jgi:hypothetical protein